MLQKDGTGIYQNLNLKNKTEKVQEEFDSLLTDLVNKRNKNEI